MSTTGYAYALGLYRDEIKGDRVAYSNGHPGVAKPHLNRDLGTHSFRLK